MGYTTAYFEAYHEKSPGSETQRSADPVKKRNQEHSQNKILKYGEKFESGIAPAHWLNEEKKSGDQCHKYQEKQPVSAHTISVDRFNVGGSNRAYRIGLFVGEDPLPGDLQKPIRVECAGLHGRLSPVTSIRQNVDPVTGMILRCQSGGKMQRADGIDPAMIV